MDLRTHKNFVHIESRPAFFPLENVRQILSSWDQDLKDFEKRQTDATKKILKEKQLRTANTEQRNVSTVIALPTENVKQSKDESGQSVKNPFDYKKYKKYLAIIEKASENRKIFSIYGNYAPLRQALLRRGWIEKVQGGPLMKLTKMPLHYLLKNAREGNEYELAAISKVLDKQHAFFIWQPKSSIDLEADVMPYRNRLRRTKDMDFTLKEGLIGCMEEAHWFTIENVSEVSAPRYHSLSSVEEQAEFLKDYHLTHCFALLTFIIENIKSCQIFHPSGVIDVKHIDFAIDRIKEEISVKNHDDIDKPNGTESEWHEFLVVYNQIIAGKDQFGLTDKMEIDKYLELCKDALYAARQYWPSIKMDGFTNVWILKPSNQCRGNGIQLLRDYSKIISQVKKHPNVKYIVQKYIERPLLIYNTKFDIRQYFLVTITTNITIWMYQDCYLKFSSQQFSLEDLQESIHLTNNSVQVKYKNGPRSELLPPHNMWTLEQFQNYLESFGEGDTWSTKIYPQMMRNVIAIVLASLDSTQLTTNSFELYGCDFILNEHFEPIHLEINSTPDLSPTTCVTAHICAATLEDLVKVVVDFHRYPNASTGNFTQIYQIPNTKSSEYVLGLVIQGVGILKKSVVKKPIPVARKISQRSPTTIKLHPARKVTNLVMKTKSLEMKESTPKKKRKNTVDSSICFINSIDPSLAAKVIEYYNTMKKINTNQNVIEDRTQEVLKRIFGKRKVVESFNDSRNVKSNNSKDKNSS